MMKLIINRTINNYYCSVHRVKFSTGNQQLATFDAGDRGFSFGEEGTDGS